MELLLQIIGGILAATTAYFYLTSDPDKAFASFVLGASAFFLAYRFRLKKRLDASTPDETALHD